VAVTEDVAAATVVILMTNTSHFPAPAPSIEGAFSCQEKGRPNGRPKRVGSRKFIEANCGYMIAGVKCGTGKFILIEVFCGFRRIDDFERYHGV